ncbi:hypothetical protein E3N88_38593 [Mikania micrantha]|uniref:Aminotransferase-like plant mobile domain-containing protein n=1 Tax=Mikania micrantha TaxID=192012 RepID=A0A5N6LUE9_9ASTR|nr:hypothetical protein E3N88_38593 [Mikania micrantha]
MAGARSAMGCPITPLYFVCKWVSDNSKADISGPMFLLQLWARERFNGFAPETVNSIDFQKPYGARWRSPLTYDRTATHVLSAYCSQLHSLTEDKFNWRPYDNVFHLLPGFCLSGQGSGGVIGQPMADLAPAMGDVSKSWWGWYNSGRSCPYQGR